MPSGIYKRIKGYSYGMSGKHHSEKTKQKMREKMIRGKSYRWKGGQYISQGYVYVLMPDHPRAMKDGYVHRSHLVAEKMLGRYLYPKEITHHKNEIKDDDRPENIEVTTLGKHNIIHKKGGNKWWLNPK